MRDRRGWWKVLRIAGALLVLSGVPQFLVRAQIPDQEPAVEVPVVDDIEAPVEEAVEEAVEEGAVDDPGSQPAYFSGDIRQRAALADRSSAAVKVFGPRAASGATFPQLLAAASSSAVAGPTQMGAAAFSSDSQGNIMIDQLELKNMDLMDVLKLIAQKTGVNIIAGSQVAGKITIFLKDVQLEDALTLVLDANGFAFQREKGIIRVMLAQEFEQRYGYKFGGDVATRILRVQHADIANLANILDQMKSLTGRIVVDPKSMTIILMDSQEKIQMMEELVRQVDVPLETRVFELTYAPVKDVAPKVSEALTPNIGTLRYDDVAKKIVVKDTPSRLREVDRIISAFDVRRREVLIEAKIVQVNLSDENKYGVDWEKLLRKHNNIKFQTDLDILTASDKRGTLSVGTVGDDDFWVLVQALQEVGDTRILSSPRISALDNEEAKIMVGSTQPYVTTTTTTPSSGPTTTAETINFIDVGIKLMVTPVIHKDNFVTMKIRPEVSSITDYLTTGVSGNEIPIKESSEAETTVMIKDGVTVVIGGLIKEDRINSVKKIPGVGDIPVIKHAFRNTKGAVAKTEIVIFLTPHIITGEQSTRDPGDLMSAPRDLPPLKRK